MEYHDSGVGTIHVVQPTWWVQCTHIATVNSCNSAYLIIIFSGPAHLILKCSHQYQEWKGDVPHMQYDLPLQQSVMEYHHPGVGTIVQSTCLVQFIHIHVAIVHGHRYGPLKC